MEQLLSVLIYLTSYTFHITFYDAAFFGTLFIGFTFFLLLWVPGKANGAATRFLALALAVAVLWTARLVAIDIRLDAYVPFWDRIPLQFSLALGPFIYFYVFKLTRPEYKFRRRDLLHFSPLLLELGAQVLAVGESIKTGTATYDTHVFQQWKPILQLLAFVSVAIYLYCSYRLILDFYQRLQFTGNDRYRYELRWLRNLLAGFGVLWLMWIPFAATDYFYYHYQPGAQAYYPLYLLLMLMMIRMAARAHLEPGPGMASDTLPVLKPLLPADLKQKGVWLKKTIKENRYYEDPELSLGSLAEKLGMHQHELSRTINIALKKNFNDFVNEYRIRDVIAKMQDPAYDRITLLGMAFDAGFNSKATFIRAFNQLTGKNPAEYKRELEKEVSTYDLQPRSRSRHIILVPEVPKWSHEQLNYHYMFRNYLKIAWRNITRNKVYTAINVLGLSLGVCACLIIYLITSFELSYDTFHPGGDRIYRIVTSMQDPQGNKSDGASGITVLPHDR